MIAAHLHASEQETRHTSKKSQPSQAQIVSPGKSLKAPSIMHQSSSRMKPNLLPYVLPAPQPEKTTHMFAPLSSIDPSYQLNLSYKSVLSIQPTAAKSKDLDLDTAFTECHNFIFFLQGSKRELGSTGASKPHLLIAPSFSSQ